MSHTRRGWLLANAAMMVLAGAGEARASGFALKEQSPVYQGTSFAGATAAADDASTIFYNPAGMGHLTTSEGGLGATYIAPSAQMTNATATRAAALGGTPISGGMSGNAAQSAIVPSGYAVVPWGDLRLGLGINAPFGLSTNYDPTWIGRYQAIKSDLQTININPSVAWRVGKTLSLGAGVQIQKADATLSKAVDFSSLLGRAPGTVADGIATVKGSDWSTGFTAGLLYEPQDGTRFGIGYRSAVFQTLSGNGTFSNVPAVPALQAVFASSAVTAKLATPDSVSFGAYHDLTKDIALMGDISWTHWSRFQNLSVNFANALKGPDTTVENWNNTWYFGLGGTYRVSDTVTLRSGVAFDQSPVSDTTRTPRIPDAARTWLSVGASWKPLPALTLSGAFSHIFVDNGNIALVDAGPGTVNFLRGNLTGTYNNAIDIVGLEAKMVF